MNYGTSSRKEYNDYMTTNAMDIMIIMAANPEVTPMISATRPFWALAGLASAVNLVFFPRLLGAVAIRPLVGLTSLDLAVASTVLFLCVVVVVLVVVVFCSVTVASEPARVLAIALTVLFLCVVVVALVVVVFCSVTVASEPVKIPVVSFSTKIWQQTSG